MVLKYTIEYLGEWESLYNKDFNYTEFGTIKNAAGSNNFVFSAKQGKLVVKVAHRNPSAVIYWHLNENYLGESMGTHSKSIQPPVGKHTLSLVDDEGNVFVKAIEVVK